MYDFGFLYFVFIVSFGFGLFIMYEANKRTIDDLLEQLNEKKDNDVYETENYFEYLVLNELKAIPCYKKIISNLYFLKDEKKTTEVDMVFICCSGIYVIEAKYRDSWIFGDVKGHYWTCFYRSGEKYKMYNPLKQNHLHVNCLKKIIGGSDSLYKSLIIFNDEAVFKSDNLEKCVNIGYLSDLKEMIIGDLMNVRLTNEEVDKIYDKLVKYSVPSVRIVKQHVDNIKKD